MPDYIHRCKNEDCNIIFKSDVKSVEYCSEACAKHTLRKRILAEKKARNDELHKNTADIPTCKICGFKSVSLIQHINLVHRLKQKKYMRMFKAKLTDIYHHSYTSQVQEKGRGDITTCKLCGNEFVKTSPNQLYCPDTCTEAGWKASKAAREKELHQLEKEGKHTPSPTRDHTCKNCGKEYTSKHPHSKYCSRKCRDNYYGKRRHTPKTTNCVQCNKEIPGRRKYCGYICRDKAKKAKDLAKDIQASKEKYGDRTDLPTCKVCGYKGKRINYHIEKYHMSVENYCKKFDIEPKTLTWEKKRKADSIRHKKRLEEGVKKHIAENQDKYRYV